MSPKSYILILNAIPFLFTGCNQETQKLKDPNTAVPNIILLVADDHGTDALGCYGNSIIKTPHLDKLAADGVLFSNAYCTSASCSASRSSILTGRFSHGIGHYGHAHDYHHFSTFDTVKSLPQYLSEAGYLTARIGKYHLAPESVYSFDEVLDCNPRSYY
jgi:N-sulfoglucosamine sulfohydrolase